MEKQLFVTVDITKTSSYDADRSDLGDLEGVGTLRWVGDKLFRWVQNWSATDLVVGDVVYHKAADAADMLKKVYTREEAGAANGALMAGVVMASIGDDSSGSAGDGDYGWIQVFGLATTANLYANGITAIAAGDILKGGATAAEPYAIYDGGYADVTATGQVLSGTIGGSTNTYTMATLTNISLVTNLSTSTLTMLTIGDTTTVNGAASLNSNIGGLAAQIITQRTFNSSVMDMMSTLKTVITQMQADIASLITAKTAGRQLIALEALASSVTIAAAKKAFVRCL